MYFGRLVDVASRDELYPDPRHPYTRALLSAVPRPDPHSEAQRQRQVLEGDVPSPLAPPTGCAFHPRCPVRDQVSDGRCAEERPGLLPLSSALNARSAACHLDAAREASPA